MSQINITCPKCKGSCVEANHGTVSSCRECNGQGKKAEFKREDRYRVFKNRDLLDYIERRPDEKARIDEALLLLGNAQRESRILRHQPPLECVCVESDWRCYEEVWSLVQEEWEASQ